MPYMIVGLIGIVALIFSQKAEASESGGGVKTRIFDLPDIEPENQGGNYSNKLDMIFEDVANRHNVPFALLKAHAIMESSLNPDAFRDENPTNREDRKGWASRGLMQLLYWPGSDRFAKYGHTSEELGNGDGLFDAHINIDIGGQLIKDNLKACNGNLRDAINMYNTGKKEAAFKAPYNYVDKVLKYYNTLIKKESLT